MEQRISAAVERTGARTGTPVIDAARHLAPGRKNFVEFVHFTDAGAQALASLVAGGLSPLLPR